MFVQIYHIFITIKEVEHKWKFIIRLPTLKRVFQTLYILRNLKFSINVLSK